MGDMIVELDRNGLVALLRGMSLDQDLCLALQKAGKMRFIGNQYNEEWEWDNKFLEDCTDDELYNLYQRFKKQQ